MLNPSRKEGEALKIKSYLKSDSLLREFARKKKMQLREKLIEKLILEAAL